MSITKISLRSFRNHDHKEVDFCKGLTLVWGENGSGKTSLLEAIGLLSFGKSFRTHKPKDLIKDGEQFFTINGKTFIKFCEICLKKFIIIKIESFSWLISD